MNTNITVSLLINTAQFDALKRLQRLFSLVCNEISPVAQKNQCWNRVALHHLVYHPMREKYPNLGSQMICNAIYSVSRTYKMVVNWPGSPFDILINTEKELPLIRFFDISPVYFDRHTLSLRKGKISLFTLEGRMLFDIHASEEALNLIQREKLKEIKMIRQDDRFILHFNFSTNTEIDQGPDLPDYFILIEEGLEGNQVVTSANDLIHIGKVS